MTGDDHVHDAQLLSSIRSNNPAGRISLMSASEVPDGGIRVTLFNNPAGRTGSSAWGMVLALSRYCMACGI
jgi:hypothetical protein